MSRVRGPFGSLSVLVALLSAPISLAAGRPVAAQLLGPEFQVNSFTTGDQGYPAIASWSDGEFVVVWESAAQDGSGDGIFAQRFDAIGAAAGGEFQVNAYTTQDQDAPAVAADDSGNFLVVWKRFASAGPGVNLFARRFDVGGAAGAEFPVDVATTGSPERPAIAAAGSGEFIVAWQTEEIVARRVGADGLPQGGEFRVNSETADLQSSPAVAARATGEFVVVWESYGQDGSSYGIFGQRFDAAGEAAGEEFQVNSATSSWQVAPSVAMGEAGEFVVVWNRDRPGGGGSDIAGQRFDPDGEPVGGEFRINTTTAGQRRRPAAALDDGGGLLVTWEAQGQDGSGAGVFAQRFDAAGAPVDGEFRVNSHTPQFQGDPRVAAGVSGTFVVSWWSDPGQDGAAGGVFARRLAPAPFSDGFESGDTSAWTATVP